MRFYVCMCVYVCDFIRQQLLDFLLNSFANSLDISLFLSPPPLSPSPPPLSWTLIPYSMWIRICPLVSLPHFLSLSFSLSLSLSLFLSQLDHSLNLTLPLPPLMPLYVSL